MANDQGPIKNALEALIHDQLKKKLISEGTSEADADKVLTTTASAHPLIDLLMTYGLPYIMQLLSNLLALLQPAPAPMPPAPVPSPG